LISFHFEQVDQISLQQGRVQSWLQEVILKEGFGQGDLAVIFCSDSYLSELNKTYLNHDTLTDVITFDYTEEEVTSGDIFISIERVKENAIRFEVEFLDELRRVMVHGILHLLGYGDKSESEKKSMRAKEEIYLALYNKLN